MEGPLLSKGEAASLRKVLYLAFIKLGRCKCHLCLLRYLSVKAQVLVEKGTDSLLCPKDGRCFFSRCACSETSQIELLLKLVPPSWNLHPRSLSSWNIDNSL